MDREQFFNLELERDILGAMLNSTYCLDLGMSLLKEEDIYNTSHKKLFNTMNILWQEGTTITPSTIYSVLKADISTVGGISYITDLMIGSMVTEGFKSLISTLKDYTDRRGIERIGMEVQKGLKEKKTTDEIINIVQENLNSFGYTEEDDGTIENTLENVMTSLEERYNTKGAIKGISTGLRELDRKINGLNKKELIIIAGRPGSGKSTVANNIAYNIVEGGGYATIFNLEMSKEQIIDKLIASVGRINFDSIRTGNMSEDDWVRYTESISKLSQVKSRFNMFDSVFNLNQIVAKARILHKKGKLGVLIVDYMQLINSGIKTGNREQEVSHISRTLKQLSAELDTTIIALSQLSRAPEQRADHRPILSDLRESGSIEQDATTIIFCYRDEYYNKETEERNIIDLIIGKQRNGTIGTVKCVWVGEWQKVANLDTGGY